MDSNLGITIYSDYAIEFTSGLVYNEFKNTLTKLNLNKDYAEKLILEDCY